MSWLARRWCGVAVGGEVHVPSLIATKLGRDLAEVRVIDALVAVAEDWRTRRALALLGAISGDAPSLDTADLGRVLADAASSRGAIAAALESLIARGIVRVVDGGGRRVRLAPAIPRLARAQRSPIAVEIATGLTWLPATDTARLVAATRAAFPLAWQMKRTVLALTDEADAVRVAAARARDAGSPGWLRAEATTVDDADLALALALVETEVAQPLLVVAGSADPVAIGRRLADARGAWLLWCARDAELAAQHASVPLLGLSSLAEEASMRVIADAGPVAARVVARTASGDVALGQRLEIASSSALADDAAGLARSVEGEWRRRAIATSGLSVLEVPAAEDLVSDDARRRLERLLADLATGRSLVAQLECEDAALERAVVAWIGARVGRPVLGVAGERAQRAWSDVAERELRRRLLAVEELGAILYLPRTSLLLAPRGIVPSLSRPGDMTPRALPRLLEGHAGSVLYSCTRSQDLDPRVKRRIALRVDLPRLDHLTRAWFWERSAADRADVDPLLDWSHAAARAPLDVHQSRRALREALMRATLEGSRLGRAHLDAVIDQISGRNER